MSGPQRLLAEFASAAAALRAARALRERGYRKVDLHAPYDMPGAAEALGLGRSRRLPRAVLAAALLGAALAYGVQWYTNSVDYPLVVGGRPLHPAPAFVPIAFEAAVLLGAFAAFFGWIASSRMGRLWQPVFETPDFERATDDRFWLVVDARDPRFRAAETRAELSALQPLRIEPPEEPK